MGAMTYTPEEERRLGLPPLPDVDTISVEEAARRNRAYEVMRVDYRAANPGRDEKGRG